MRRLVSSMVLMTLGLMTLSGCSAKVDAYRETSTSSDGTVTERTGVKAEVDGKTRINIEK